MVVFTCNACSAVLKRNQVDKHCHQCRRCESLSCVDCGKDFWGDDYLQHTKCMTEEEKYCGKDHVPKVFKGEAKQEQWVEQVQAAIERSSSNPKLKNLLERLKEYSNIPRKKIKFENFVKNSLRVHNPSLVSEVWDVLMTNNKNDDQNKGNGTSDEQSKPNGEAMDSQPSEDITESAPKNKRERKEERRKKAQKKEKKHKQEEKEEELQPKRKKRKRDESDEEENPSMENDTEQEGAGKKRKKNKKKRGEALDVIENENEDDMETESRLKDDEEEEDEEEEELPPPKKKKLKFDWEQVIKAVLKKKGEMPLKKLRKKVLNEFAAQDGANYSEENLYAKFNKKVLRIEGVKVHKDRASLKLKR